MSVALAVVCTRDTLASSQLKSGEAAARTAEEVPLSPLASVALSVATVGEGKLVAGWVSEVAVALAEVGSVEEARALVTRISFPAERAAAACAVAEALTRNGPNETARLMLDAAVADARTAGTADVRSKLFAAAAVGYHKNGDPGTATRVLNLARSVGLGGEAWRRYASLREVAEAANRMGDRDGAIRILLEANSLAKADPGPAALEERRAVVFALLQMGAGADAVHVAEELGGEQLAWYYDPLVKWLIKEGRLEEALRFARELPPAAFRIHSMGFVAGALSDTGHRAEALALLDEAAALAPLPIASSSYPGQGTLYMFLSLAAEAVQDWDRALMYAGYSNSSVQPAHVACAMHRAGDDARARSVLRATLAGTPDVYARFRIIEVLFDNGWEEEGRGELRDWVAAEEQSLKDNRKAELPIRFVELMLRVGRLDDAIRLIKSPGARANYYPEHLIPPLLAAGRVNDAFEMFVKQWEGSRYVSVASMGEQSAIQFIANLIRARLPAAELERMARRVREVAGVK